MNKVHLLNYSFIAIALSFAGLPLYIYAPDFYVRDFGISLSTIGIILILVRLFDAVQDPLIGYFSDKYHTKKIPIISTGIFILLAGIGSIFYGPPIASLAVIWFAIGMILATTGFSIIMINLTTIGGLHQTSSYERTRLSAWRESFFLIGVLIASLLLAFLQETYETQSAFIITFWVFAGLLMIGFILLYKFLKNHTDNTNTVSDTKLTFWPQFETGQKSFLITYFTSHLGSAIPGVIVFIFVRDYLNASEFAGIFLALYFLSGAIFMKLWITLAKSKDKNYIWFLSMILSIVTFIWALFLSPGDTLLYGIICVLSGIALGADLALPPVILSDKIALQKTEHKATQSYALLTFTAKIAIAIASGLSFIALDLIGFKAGIENSAETLNLMLLLYALIPCLIKGISAFLLWHFYIKKGV